MANTTAGTDQEGAARARPFCNIYTADDPAPARACDSSDHGSGDDVGGRRGSGGGARRGGDGAVGDVEDAAGKKTVRACKKAWERMGEQAEKAPGGGRELADNHRLL